MEKFRQSPFSVDTICILFVFRVPLPLPVFSAVSPIFFCLLFMQFISFLASCFEDECYIFSFPAFSTSLTLSPFSSAHALKVNCISWPLEPQVPPPEQGSSIRWWILPGISLLQQFNLATTSINFYLERS